MPSDDIVDGAEDTGWDEDWYRGMFSSELADLERVQSKSMDEAALIDSYDGHIAASPLLAERHEASAETDERTPPAPMNRRGSNVVFLKRGAVSQLNSSRLRKFAHSPVSRISEKKESLDESSLASSPDQSRNDGEKSNKPILCAQCGGLLKPKKRADGRLGSFMYMKSRGMIRRWESRFFYHDGSSQIRFYADRPSVGLDDLSVKAAKTLGVEDARATKHAGSRKSWRGSSKSILRTVSKIKGIISDKGSTASPTKSDAVDDSKVLGVIDLRDTEIRVVRASQNIALDHRNAAIVHEFHIWHPVRPVYQISASSHFDMNRWLEALQVCEAPADCRPRRCVAGFLWRYHGDESPPAHFDNDNWTRNFAVLHDDNDLVCYAKPSDRSPQTTIILHGVSPNAIEHTFPKEKGAPNRQTRCANEGQGDTH